MRIKDITKRILVAFLVLAMVVVYTPASFAGTLNYADVGEASETEETVAFAQEKEIDGVVIRAEAEPGGCFPKMRS